MPTCFRWGYSFANSSSAAAYRFFWCTSMSASSPYNYFSFLSSFPAFSVCFHSATVIIVRISSHFIFPYCAEFPQTSVKCMDTGV